MKVIKRILIFLVVIIFLAADWIIYQTNNHTKLDRYAPLTLAPKEAIDPFAGL